MKEITYKHPHRYKGMKITTEERYRIFLNHVETNCFRCELFMGREHDFEDCKGVFRPYDDRYMKHDLRCIYDKDFEHYSLLYPFHKYDYDRR